MDASFLKEWGGAVAIVLSLGGTVYAWLTSRSKVNAEHLKRVDEDIGDHERRIQKLENEFDHLPSKDMVTDLKLSISDLKGTVGRLDESVGGITRTVRRVEDFLMKGDK